MINYFDLLRQDTNNQKQPKRTNFMKIFNALQAVTMLAVGPTVMQVLYTRQLAISGPVQDLLFVVVAILYSIIFFMAVIAIHNDL